MTASHHESSYLTTDDGLQLYCRSDRPADPTAAVMLLHGLGEHSGRYEHVIDALVDAGCWVFAVDHRGHGRSEGARVFVRRYDQFMSDVELVRDDVDTRRGDLPLIVLGHSMGGNLATGHALAHPDGIAGLALSGPALQAGDDFGVVQQKVLSVLGRWAPKLRPQGLDSTSISRDQQVVADYLADPLVYSGKITTGLAAALFDAMDSFPTRYVELHMPVLLLHGTDDRLATIDGSRELEALAVNADITAHYYDGLYHEVFNEPERDQVIADLIEWIDTVR